MPPLSHPAKPRVVAIVQARVGSSRLPGKTLADIVGKPLLGHILDRVSASRRVDEVVVATTTEPGDEAVAILAAKWGMKVVRGSVDDVLDRFHQAALAAGADIVVRITADDPFKDPDVIDLVAERLLADPTLDYASNTLEPTFPEGLDVEVLQAAALARAWQEARLPSEREHVTPFIWKQPCVFRLASIRQDRDLSRLRWTIDYEADLAFCREIYRRLYGHRIFKMDDILRLLAAEPHLGELNRGIARNSGYQLSVERDPPAANPPQ